MVVMVGTWPSGHVSLHPFTDRHGCEEAMSALSQVITSDYKMFCYDMVTEEAVSRRAKGKAE